MPTKETLRVKQYVADKKALGFRQVTVWIPNNKTSYDTLKKTVQEVNEKYTAKHPVKLKPKAEALRVTYWVPDTDEVRARLLQLARDMCERYNLKSDHTFTVINKKTTANEGAPYLEAAWIIPNTTLCRKKFGALVRSLRDAY